MAGKIVGITIQLEGDNSNLTKSLKEVDKQVAQTTSALKDVDKALKLSGGKDVELLAQKQALLTKQIEGTNEKLKIMKQVAQDAAKGLQDGTVTQEQYAKLTAEISKAEQNLVAMNQAAEDNAKALRECEDGTVQMNEALAKMDENIDKTDRALRTVNEALKLNPDSIELSATRQELLTKQVEQTRDKLELMRESAEKAAEGLEKGTVTKEEYAELSAQLAVTEKEFADLENAASASADALGATGEGAEEAGEGIEEAGKDSKTGVTAFGALDKATGGLASSLAALAANPITAVIAALGLLITAVKKSIDEMKKIADTIKNLIVAAVEKLADVLSDVTEQIDQTIRKLAEFTKEGASYADEVKTMAAQTGLATDEIQRLMYISELVDVDLSTMTGAMTKLEKAMSSAAKGSGDALGAFKKLGVEFKNQDGTYRKAHDVFNDLVTALGGIDDEVERDTIAMTLFGKSAKDLNPLIKASQEDLERFTQAAEESGYILSDEVLDAYGDFDDSLQMLDKACEAAQHGLGLVLLPVLSQVASEGVPLLNELASGIVNANGDIEEIGKVIDTVLPKALDTFVKNLPQMVEVVKKLITTFLTSLNNNLPAILDAGIQILKALVDGLLNPESIGTIMDSVVTIVNSFVEFLHEHGEEIIQLGVFILTTIIDGLAQVLPELIPAMAEALGIIIDELTKPETLDTIIDAAITLFESLIDGLDRALPTIIEKLPDAVQRIADKLQETQMIEKIVDAGIKLFQSLLDSGVIDKVMDVLGANAGPIADLCVQIGLKIAEFKWKITKEVTSAFVDVGKQMCLDILAGFVEKIPFVGEQMAIWLKSLGIASNSANWPTTPTYPHIDNNNQNPGRSQEQQDLINAGEGQFYHPPQNGGVGTASMNATSLFFSGEYADTAGKIANAITDADITVNAYIGDEKLDTLMTKAQGRANYISGGR